MTTKRSHLPFYAFSLFHQSQTVYTNALKTTGYALILLFGMGVFISYMTDLPVRRLTAPVAANGAPLTNSPISSQLYSNDEVQQWVFDASSRLFTFSNLDTPRRLSELKMLVLTPTGYKSFYDQLVATNIFKWLERPHRVLSFVPVDIRLERNGISSQGMYKWRWIVTGQLFFVSNGRAEDVDYELTIDAVRVSQLGHIFAVRIDRVFAKNLNEES